MNDLYEQQAALREALRARMEERRRAQAAWLGEHVADDDIAPLKAAVDRQAEALAAQRKALDELQRRHRAAQEALTAAIEPHLPERLRMPKGGAR
jgi:ribosomal 50S subunit-associated protein YjgA (DUF615 family)